MVYALKWKEATKSNSIFHRNNNSPNNIIVVSIEMIFKCKYISIISCVCCDGTGTPRWH